MTSRIDRQKGVLKTQFPDRLAKARQIPRLVRAWIAACTLILAAESIARAQGLRFNEDIISDPQTGAAILGFDPVAYFAENAARAGRPDMQALFGGKVWYFVSTANKAAFERAPDSYLPAFGGHDPVAIAAGIPLSGSPSLFLVVKDRIILFRNPESREAFLADPSIILSAEQNWPQVKRNLVP